jgi:hypothetical protein
MSIFEPHVVECPHCGARERRSIARSIAAARRPDLRDAILADRFQRFDCDGCGARFAVDGPFFYFDLDRRHWLGVYPERWEDSWRALEKEVAESFRLSAVEFAPRMIRDVANEFVVRLVFGLAALRDKLLCLDAGLDDGWLEVLKLRLLRDGEVLRFSPAERPSLTRVGEGLRFSSQHGDEIVELEVARARLDELRQDRAWDVAYQQLTGGPYVDVGRVLFAGNSPARSR